MPIRILIVDSQPVVHWGVEALAVAWNSKAEATEQIEVAGKIGPNGSADATLQLTLQRIESAQPDLVLIEVFVANRDGFTALQEIRSAHPDLPIVVFSAQSSPTYLARSISLGANEFISKRVSADTLFRVILTVAAGETVAGSEFEATKSNLAHRRQPQAEHFPLTARELQVLRHIAQGLSNREVGANLGISVETVKEHVQNTLRKLSVNDRTQAAIWACKRGLV